VQHGDLPAGLELQRTTDEFDIGSVPPGLLRAHRLGTGVWGLLEVIDGSVSFVWEDDPDAPITLVAGDSLVIRPEVPHHVEPGRDARFTVAFYR
jgi:tellurite resistance-related uncharacterized protein